MADQNMPMMSDPAMAGQQPPQGYQAPQPPEEPWKNLSEDQLKRLGSRICRMIDESTAAQGKARRDRWNQLQKLYEIDETAVSMSFIEGMSAYQFPILRQKMDRIVGSTYNSLTSIYPAIQVVDETDGDGGNISDIERAIENVSIAAGRNKAIKQSILTAGLTNRSVWFIYPEVKDGHVSGICWKNLHPQNVMVYPAEVTDWNDAEAVGHRRFEQYRTVRQKMKTGEYLKNDMVKGGDDPNKHRLQDPKTKPSGKLTQPVSEPGKSVEVWEVVVYIDLASLSSDMDTGDGDYQRFVVTVAYTSQQTLSIEPYPDGQKIWYVPVSLKEDMEDQAWPNDSVAQTIQHHQLLVNDLITIAAQGSIHTAGAPIFTAGGGLDKKVEKFAPFTVYEIDENAKVFSFPPTFNPQNLVMIMEMVGLNAGELTGITRLGTGGDAPDRETATATLNRQQAQSEAKDNYSDQAADALQVAADLIYGYLTYYFDDLKKVYGSKIPIKPGVIQQDPGLPPPPVPGIKEIQPGVYSVPQGMRLKMLSPRFDVTGRGGDSPQTLIPKLQSAMQLAQMPGSPIDPLLILMKMMYAMELPFGIEGLKKSQQQMQLEMQKMQSSLQPGVLERLNIAIADLLPQEHAQFVQKYLQIQPDDTSEHPKSFGSQATLMLMHAVQGLLDGSVSEQTAKMLVQHVMEMRNGGSTVPGQMKEQQQQEQQQEQDGSQGT